MTVPSVGTRPWYLVDRAWLGKAGSVTCSEVFYLAPQWGEASEDAFSSFVHLRVVLKSFEFMANFNQT